MISSHKNTTVLMLIGLLSTAYTQAKVQKIGSEEEFVAMVKSGKPAVIKFYADYCGACKSAKQPFEEVSDEAEFAMVTFADLDTQAQQDLARQFNIEGIPTFIYINNGTPVEKTSGMHPTMFKDNLRNDIRKNLMSGQSAETPSATQAEQPAQPMPAAPQSGDFMSSIKNFFIMLFTTIKNMIVGFFNWIKGLFGK